MGNFGGISQPTVSTENIWHEPQLFGSWQQRHGLSLTVLQQLVNFIPAQKYLILHTGKNQHSIN